ncbi:MAG: hypothetical protein ABR987_10670, partial [Terracidiphilus sp.]
GRYFYFFFPDLSPNSYAMPVIPSTGLPKAPPAGFVRIEDFANQNINSPIPWYAESAVGISTYAYTRTNTRRNLYRIQLP